MDDLTDYTIIFMYLVSKYNIDTSTDEGMETALDLFKKYLEEKDNK